MAKLTFTTDVTEQGNSLAQQNRNAGDDQLTEQACFKKCLDGLAAVDIKMFHAALGQLVDEHAHIGCQHLHLAL